MGLLRMPRRVVVSGHPLSEAQIALYKQAVRETPGSTMRIRRNGTMKVTASPVEGSSLQDVENAFWRNLLAKKE